MLRLVLQTRGPWKFSLADIKNIFCRSDLWSKISHVLDVQLEIFYHKLTTVNQSDDAYENSMGNLKDLQPALHRVNP